MIDHGIGSEETDAGKDDIKLLFRTIVPFLQKWIQVPKNYDQLYQQAMKDMDQPDYTAKWEIVTAWGTNPQQQEKLPMIEHH
ncbi:MAG: hypothetical protein H0U76_15110 [Ktedonobacteraceae bacterium]|nr:hypothetical protein [Ktedonobacteraceae bacterium]